MWSLAGAITEAMATFNDLKNHIHERKQRAQMVTLGAQMADTRNALASNETWLRANSPLVRGWKLRALEAKSETANAT